ncbi:MAG: hypothetical protein SO179_03135 [Bacteroidales bacterium]|nr:hypothetical protein [Bacteroidales bacterium]
MTCFGTGREIEIGDNSGIGINAHILNNTIIGNNVMMGPNCCMLESTHLFNRTDIVMRKQGRKKERDRVVVGDDVWIGRDVMIIGVCKGFARLFIPTEFAKMYHSEKGYVYFQDFIPNNSFDIRVVVVGDKAFALKRLVRKNDFRASGGGSIIYDKNQIDERCVKIAFDVNEKIQSQSIAYDFVFDKDNNPLIVEISYGYSKKAYDKCEGYWDMDLNWHKGENFDFCGWMIEQVM